MTAALLDADTFWELVQQRATLTPAAAALLDEHDARLTFAELREAALRTAAGLQAAGVGPGSRVGWQLPTRISTVLVMLALARLGAFQAPVLPMYREHELSTLVPAAGADLLLVPGTWRGTDYVAQAAPVLQLAGRAIRLLAVGPAGLDGDPAGLPPVAADPAAPRWAFATSGSTGVPRAAVHSDHSLLTAARGFARNTGAGSRPGDVGCIAFPIGHVGGSQYLATALMTGTPTVLVEAFVPGQSLEVFRRHGVTVIGGSTALYQAVLGEQRRAGAPVLPGLRLLTGGGAPLSAGLYRELRAELGVQVAHCYGMTEVPMVGVANPDDPDELLATTDGRLIPGVQARVVGADGTVLPAGEEGEMQLRGDAVTAGYTDPGQDAAAFTDDGWLRTGDLVRLAPTGHVSVTGRIKDVIIRKGETISALEVEELLLDQPEVAEVAVVGLPDPERGERVCAVVRPADPAFPPRLADLTARLRAVGLMAQKLPEQLELVDAMPLTGLGKIAKAELRARFTEAVRS